MAMDPQLRRAALEYHSQGQPGKISILPTKQLINQRDLALAYTPGVAAACEEIAADPASAHRYTSRGNLVAVITNGTAVLGLGNIGPLAAKPVMEGKGVLFKKFAGIDVFDIELDQLDVDKLVDAIAALEPTFGGINLEDIKAPECFAVERRLRERMKIPVFHDDQHGTAITVAAAVLNGLEVVGKKIQDCRLVASGAGAAALACLQLLVDLGLPRGSIWVTDIEGVVWKGRTALMDPEKERYAQDTPLRTLGEVIDGADIFLGLSAGGVLKPEMVARMAPRPLILALANPHPEILPEDVHRTRDDAVMATGRSDYPNQVNNVLCFPFVFRGALDVGATTITREMEVAAVEAIAELARAELSDEVAAAYGANVPRFGPEYLIPRPFDPRLILSIAPAVARAAMASGVATRPIADFELYREQLKRFVYHSGNFMKPIFAAARQQERRRVVLAEGEEERVLRAAQIIVDERLARPCLIGRPDVVTHRMDRLGLRIKPDADFDLINPEQDDRYREYWQEYHRLMDRRGVNEQLAKIEMRRGLTLIAAMMLHQGHADGMVCGTVGSFHSHLEHVDQILGHSPGATCYGAMNTLMLPDRQVTLVDTHANYDPTAEELAQITGLAVEALKRVGVHPKVALVSHSSFGSSSFPSARKMRDLLTILRERCPDLEVDGEMRGDAALSGSWRKGQMPRSTLEGDANLLVLPNLDSANIAYNLLKMAAGNNIAIGPVLLGCARPAHIVTASATVRRIVNLVAWTVAEINQAHLGIAVGR